jgi:heterodisulfide reductase subunit A
MNPFSGYYPGGGLNKYLFEMANMRSVSWVHATHMPESTEKSKDLVRMAVARAETLLPLHQQRSEIKRRALIIGGGLSGMTAAQGIAAQGFEAVLVEREKELGGNIRNIFYTDSGSNPQTLLNTLIKQVESDPNVKVYTGAAVKALSGYLGNYVTEITTAEGKNERIEHGVVIIATGGAEYKPIEYLDGQSPNIITQLELEKKLAAGEAAVKNAKSVVMIQCVGSDRTISFAAGSAAPRPSTMLSS